MMQRDYYQTLGVGRHASQADIRAAYIRLARRHHPDGGSEGAALLLPGRLRDIQQAYRSLSNAEERRRHDTLLDEAERHHRVRQQAVQRRLSRYDRRHPRPRLYRSVTRPSWRSLVMMGVGLAIVARVSLTLIG
ncbi:hypothetical protein ASE86_14235 [Sphingomonas sp. Leaf33]|uniref:J domain-containing protein n=1 Tax=Sphingomonas sp. Leaf33 TaxID=1736215 RepID=UPI0006FA5AAD|nr:DnaJ domain-containing protein [Sphingomonas sp. Leaf33]KQN22932.1 hypothetical protein ASE86_14235 [Sphingomonas sp. Leaf33]